MIDQVEQRLEELQTEFAAGKTLLADLRARQDHVSSSLLRISGAIRVLEELLGRTEGAEPASPILSTVTTTDVRSQHAS